MTDEPMPIEAVPLLFHLSYCSRAAPGLTDADVERIVETARRRNHLHGITGLLTFGAGVFFQWLEGPRDAVLGLMELLRVDKRHDHVVTLAESEEARDRIFPAWDMEWVSAADIGDVLSDALGSTQDPAGRRSLQVLLDRVKASAM
jgi:hypothetical protein